MSNSPYVLGLYLVAFVIQAAAVVLVLSLTSRLRYHRTATLLLACGLALMAVRRLVPFKQFAPGLGFLSGDLVADSVLSVAISCLLFFGLFGLRTSMNRLEDYTDLIESRSRTDYLTGAWNRLEIERRTEQEIGRGKRYASPLALILFDIDHFKQVNDSYGHDAGDEVLRSLVSFCQKSIREIDVLGRFGGEEFLILMPNTSEAEAFAAAERLRKGIEGLACVSAHGKEIRVTVSLGVAVLRPSKETDTYQAMKQLISRSDRAMYQAKESGRNQTRAGAER